MKRISKYILPDTIAWISDVVGFVCDELRELSEDFRLVSAWLVGSCIIGFIIWGVLAAFGVVK